MSAARNLLAELQTLGVEITPNGDRLHIKAPVGIITPAIRETLASHKADILNLLAANNPAPRYPYVWIATVDGRRVWIIDHDHTAHSEQLRSLCVKFGPARVADLQRAEIAVPRSSFAQGHHHVSNQ